MAKNFQVGLTGEGNDDPWFETEKEAIDYAWELHRRTDFNRDTVGVWNRRGEYLYLFFHNEMFKRI